MDEAESPHKPYQRLRDAQRAECIARDRTPDSGEPVVRRGEVWRLGDHRLMCGDCTVADDVKLLLAGVAPHLMVTDPPWGVGYDAAWRAKAFNRLRAPRSVMNDDRADWREAFALFSGDVAYVYYPSLHSDVAITALESVRLMRRSSIIWVKPHFVIGRGDYHRHYEPCWYVVREGGNSHWQEARDKSDVWTISRDQDGRDDRTIHGTQKPVECMLRPIENSSRRGDAVYDPFVGSGTTIIAAEIAGRRCYAMDIDPVCCTMAIERWQSYTDREAFLEAKGRKFDEVKNERLSHTGQERAAPGYDPDQEFEYETEDVRWAIENGRSGLVDGYLRRLAPFLGKLGDMVDPNGRSELQLKPSRRRRGKPRKEEQKSFEETIHQELRFARVRAGGKLEAAVAEVSRKHRISRTTAFRMWKRFEGTTR
jgi:DNA modification methylase